jgi:hypothetical protein
MGSAGSKTNRCAAVNKVMNLGVPHKAGNLFLSDSQGRVCSMG